MRGSFLKESTHIWHNHKYFKEKNLKLANIKDLSVKANRSVQFED